MPRNQNSLAKILTLGKRLLTLAAPEHKRLLRHSGAD
jgi:hypothetical protein